MYICSNYRAVTAIFQLEMKQRYLVGKMNVPEEKEGIPDEVTMESLGEDSSHMDHRCVPDVICLTIFVFLLSS